jgi:uncharacterized coiled-coil DUF342 family protein
MELMQQEFDFLQVAPEVRERVIERDIRFDCTKRQVEGGLIEMGRILIEQKKDLQHGLWLKWLESKGFEETAAKRLMSITEKFQNVQIARFQKSALYLLAQDSTPEPVRQEAIEKAQNGDKVTHADAKALIESYKRQLETKEQSISALKERIKVFMQPTPNQKKIEELKAELEAERKKPAQVKEVVKELIPDDYEALKTQKAELEKDIKQLKKKQDEIVDRKVNAKFIDLGKEIEGRNTELERVKNNIEKLRKTETDLEKKVGAFHTYRETCDKVRHHLYEISIVLQDAFDSDPIPDEFMPELNKFVRDMENGAKFLNDFINGEPENKKPRLEVVKCS